MKKVKVEFGDFQTPRELALLVIAQIPNIERYDKFIEPTCGLGTFLNALLIKNIPYAKLEGWEVNSKYVAHANHSLSKEIGIENINIVKEQDFFEVDFSTVNLSKSNHLFIGNPPWVTNSELGRLLSNNLPEKNNFKGLSGLEAMTGKSNFDISEWMLIQLLEKIAGNNSSVAFLIKTSVARKLFEYSCKNDLHIDNFIIRKIDAKMHFGVSVDACLFYASGNCEVKHCSNTVEVYSKLTDSKPESIMGFSNNKLVSNISSYNKFKEIDSESDFKWRSGIKHDASKIMEFKRKGEKIVNGLGEEVDIPEDYLYPMYKSSNISKDSIDPPQKLMLVTQKKIGDKTDVIENISNGTWRYLCDHSEKLDARKSSIYKNAPRFSVFGVGEYSFKPWKVVISGLYKNTKFTKIGTYEGKPIIVDDTCYMLGFDTEEEADFILSLLLSLPCQKFIKSIIFLDNKRPITVALLNRINLRKVAEIIGQEKEYKAFSFNS